MDIKGLRKEYANRVLTREMLGPGTRHGQFERGSRKPQRRGGSHATTLATVGADGQPTRARCRSNCSTGTALSSTPATTAAARPQQIAATSGVALLFPSVLNPPRWPSPAWPEGELWLAARYFASRPHESQWRGLSPNSRGAHLPPAAHERTREDPAARCRCPISAATGCGRRVSSSGRARPARLHDRFLYTRQGRTRGIIPKSTGRSTCRCPGLSPIPKS